jgi:hypothetical protein
METTLFVGLVVNYSVIKKVRRILITHQIQIVRVPCAGSGLVYVAPVGIPPRQMGRWPVRSSKIDDYQYIPRLAWVNRIEPCAVDIISVLM